MHAGPLPARPSLLVGRRSPCFAEAQAPTSRSSSPIPYSIQVQRVSGCLQGMSCWADTCAHMPRPRWAGPGAPPYGNTCGGKQARCQLPPPLLSVATACIRHCLVPSPGQHCLSRNSLRTHRLKEQSQGAVSRSSLMEQSHGAVSRSSLMEQSQGAASRSSLMEQSQGAVSRSSSKEQSQELVTRTSHKEQAPTHVARSKYR